MLERGINRLIATVLLSALAVAVVPARAANLPADLRARVDRLIADVKAEPTDNATAVERVAVLWEWANAISLDGGFVPKNLPLIAGGIPNPTPGSDPVERYFEAVDTYTRLLDLLERDASALGSTRMETAAVARAGEHQTLTVKLTVGSLGIRPGGGLLISNHALASYGRLQNEDPADAGYVAISTNRPGVTFERDQAPVWGPYGGFRGPQPFPVYRVVGTALRAGDQITLVYGDRSRGGGGLRIAEFSNDAVALPLHLDPGDGRFYELEPPTFRVEGGAAFAVHGFAPSIVLPDEPFAISVRTEDRFYNRATTQIPAYRVLRNGEPFRDLPAGKAIHQLEVVLTDAGVHRFTFESAEGQVSGVANPVWVRPGPGPRIFWGETHGHCGFAEGQGTPDGYFEFARDDAKLDFVTLSEHDIWLTDGNWKTLNEAAARFHRDGQLVVFPGYEWSAQRQRGGHHNVFFRRPGVPRVGVQIAPNLTDLYRELRQRYDPKDVLIIPHAHQAGDWRLSDLDMETLIEIMSSHGTFEWFGQRYLEHGYRVGFVGASDDHLGHPGYAPGHPASENGRRSNIFQFGGLAGAWAESKATDAIFDALKSRHAYATSGSQRIILDARLNGAPMGSAVDDSAERRIEGRAIGTAAIRRVDLLKNNQAVATQEPAATTATAGGTREIVVAFSSESSVSIRDNPRGHRTWRGTLVIDGARASATRLLGSPQPTVDLLELEDGKIRFDIATRGSTRTIAIALEGASPATRLRFDLEPAREQGTAPLQIRKPQTFPARSFALALPGSGPSEEVIEADGYRDRVRVDDPRSQQDLEFAFTNRGEPGDWYTLRVEQVDGHMAWSSPWWVGGEPPR